MLLHVPVFASADRPEYFLRFAECTLQRQARSSSSAASVIDLLVGVGGCTAISAGSGSDCTGPYHSMAAGISKQVGYLRNVFVEEVRAGNVAYDRTGVRKDWNRGPNEVFYDAMLPGGLLFESYTRQYDFIFQLETDTCALANGWLDAALAPMKDSAVLVSGSTLKGTCILNLDMTKPFSPCISSTDADLAPYIKHHLNGNSLYRVDSRLQAVFDYAKRNYSHLSFDVAGWLAARQLNLGAAMHDNERMYNAFHPVGHELASASFPPSTAFVHVPWRFRTNAVFIYEWCQSCAKLGDSKCASSVPQSAACTNAKW